MTHTDALVPAPASHYAAFALTDSHAIGSVVLGRGLAGLHARQSTSATIAGLQNLTQNAVSGLQTSVVFRTLISCHPR